MGHRQIDYTYPNLIYQLRLVHLVALVLQAFALYLWCRELGLGAFCVPFALMCVNFYLVFKRFYYSIDGRYDFQQIFAAKNHQLRLHYCIGGYFFGFQLRGGLATAQRNFNQF